MSLYHIFQYTLHVGIEHLHRQFAAFGCLVDGLILLVLTRLQHIVTSHHSSYGIVACIPIAYKHALPSPLVANNRSKQLTILNSIRAIQLVIRCHDGPRITLLHHNLKGFQVYFAQRTLRYLRDIVVTVCLLVVSHKMLGTCSCTLTLNTLHIAGSDSSREIRIL